MEEGIVNSEGEFPFYEWSTTEQRLTETLEEPLNTSQVVSGLGDILARLSTDPDHVRMFKTSRPLSANMTGGPVRLQIQFFYEARLCGAHRQSTGTGWQFSFHSN